MRAGCAGWVEKVPGDSPCSCPVDVVADLVGLGSVLSSRRSVAWRGAGVVGEARLDRSFPRVLKLLLFVIRSEC